MVAAGGPFSSALRKRSKMKAFIVLMVAFSLSVQLAENVYADEGKDAFHSKRNCLWEDGMCVNSSKTSDFLLVSKDSSVPKREFLAKENRLQIAQQQIATFCVCFNGFICPLVNVVPVGVPCFCAAGCRGITE
jgi:hypothetical protein